MKNWLDVVVDATPVRSIFGDDAPLLEKVDLHEVTLHRDGPCLSLRFDLPTLPKELPVKWRTQGLNCIQLKLMLVGAGAVTLSGWGTQSVVSLDINQVGNQLRLVSRDGPVALDVTADSIVIEKISAYRI